MLFNQAVSPLSWDATWNQWKHLLGATMAVRANIVPSGKYRRRGDGWELVQWETALPSRVEVRLPADYGPNQRGAKHPPSLRSVCRCAWMHPRPHRTAPVERTALQQMCDNLGIPGDFDVAQITWRPDYDAFFYRQLCRRAHRLYLFRSEYTFDLQNVTVVETPQLGHATYLFTKQQT